MLSGVYDSTGPGLTLGDLFSYFLVVLQSRILYIKILSLARPYTLREVKELSSAWRKTNITSHHI